MRTKPLRFTAGYDPDPTTKSVAVPIYQTVAYAFDSADHGRGVCSTSKPKAIATAGSPIRPPRCSRSASPNSRRRRRARGRLRTGRAAFALVNLADSGGNIVSVPQLYGTTHTLLAHVLPRQGITTRFAGSDKADAIEKLIDENTKAVFSETIGNPPAMSATSKRWRRSRIATACRWWSTTPSPRRSS